MLGSWRELSKQEQIEDIKRISADPENLGVVLFKHSTRCSISAMALNRLERKWNFDSDRLPFYFLDLLNHRDISAKIAEVFSIRHESPQLLFIKNGKCLYNASHGEVSVETLAKFIDSQYQHS